MTLSQELAEGLAIANYFDYENGARGESWTPDQRLMSPLLYHWATLAKRGIRSKHQDAWSQDKE